MSPSNHSPSGIHMKHLFSSGARPACTLVRASSALWDCGFDSAGKVQQLRSTWIDGCSATCCLACDGLLSHELGRRQDFSARRDVCDFEGNNPISNYAWCWTSADTPVNLDPMRSLKLFGHLPSAEQTMAWNAITALLLRPHQADTSSTAQVELPLATARIICGGRHRD